MNIAIKNNMKNIAFIVATVFMLLFCAVVISMRAQPAGASAPVGLAAKVATTSQLTVGPGNNIGAFGTTTREYTYSCAARIISTVGQPIMISFSSIGSTTLSQTLGHQQPASTTVVYDGGQFGCGRVTIRGLNASSTITVTETQ